ncbi:hypothetical protein [Mycoplasma sp. P36-A1]|uniref:hypothetical protein n=1 Tax=Mycoplasma sp. P36-A1 TaxID=3252900 RepID=UPI003C2C2B86
MVNEFKGKPNLFEWGIGDSYSLKELEEQNLFLDKDLLKRTNPSFNISIDYKTVVQEYKTLDNLDFAVQRLGLLHSIENKAIFNQNSIERVLTNQDEAQKYKGEFILGIKFSTDYHCAVIAAKNKDKIYLQVLDKRMNKDGFDWVAKYILENSNIKGVVADGMFRDTFGEMIKKKFKKRYKKINSHEFLAGQQLLEYQINTNVIDIASQQGITDEFLNVTWKQKGDYKKFTSLNVEQDISVIEAMALASNYAAERFK